MATKKVKVQVLKAFIDRRSKRVHAVGDVLSITETRLAEIRKVDPDLVQEIN